MADTTTDDAPATTAKSGETVRAEAPRDEKSVAARVVTIDRPAQELYDFWRDFANLPQVMTNIRSITVLDRTRSHWVVDAPGGKAVEWDALVTEDEPGRVIGWESSEGSDLRNSGRVEFIDAGDRGTVVKATIAYDPPGGAIGQFIAKLFQKEPGIQARRDLKRFKMLMETGEIATAARTPAERDERDNA